ncbi:hypothetical protein [Shewanella phaeophyticola]|uniref:Uncharacterized protein n=1 Tax=Shewanella phaeophyticola TaxID=2978345 RepID=A0ABT2P3H7_9GAMM|nr:hypothetical protein [Shewanella sp. KJ10-1]MCT8987037.1 hypothetical protein [Shewanella sp. KJ10-1]
MAVLYNLSIIFSRFKRIFSIEKVKALVLVGTVVGFVFCVFATYKWPEASYFLLPTRAWEMMFGGVAYLYPVNVCDVKKKIIERVGFFNIRFFFNI